MAAGRWIWLMIVAAMLLAAGEAAHAQDKRIALLIGNQSYDTSVGVLQNPHNDIRVVGAALKQQGFEVLPEVRDARRSTILGAVRQLRDRLITAGNGAVGFVYYSGHGAAESDTGVNYIIPVDAKQPGSAEFWDESLKLDDILKLLDGARGAAKFIVFDACRNELRVPAKSTTKGLVPVSEQQGMLIAYATSPGRTASDQGQVSGPFAAALAAELAKPGLDHLNLFQNVKETVLASTNGVQQPWINDGLARRVQITTPAAEPVAPPAPAPLPQPPMSEAAQAWSATQNSTSIAVLEAFAGQYPNTVFATMARARIEELRKTQASLTMPTAAAQAPIPGSLTARGEVAIATIGPMTGPNAQFGAQMRAGAEQAVSDINAAGGVNGKRLRLIIQDDACDPRQAVAGAGKLADQKVKLVAGHFCSGSSIPASKVYAAEGIIQISPASSNPKLTDERAGPNVFRVSGRDDRQGTFAGRYLVNKFKGKKLAILHDKSIYGRGIADEAKDYVNRAGLKEVLYDSYAAGEKDYGAIVSKLKAANIDVVYIGGFHAEVGLIVRQMREQGLKAQVISGDALVTQEFWQVTGNAGEGTLMTFSPDPRKNSAAAHVVARFKAKNIDPEGYVLYTYAAVQTWALAANAAKTEDSNSVQAKMAELEFRTVLGNFRFDTRGDPTLDGFAMYRWSRGNFKQLEE